MFIGWLIFNSSTRYRVALSCAKHQITCNKRGLGDASSDSHVRNLSDLELTSFSR
jgi:hypothetical protein